MTLTEDDLKTLTGYTRRAEQKKELEHLLIPYKVRRDKSLVVAWSDVQANGTATRPEPELQL